MNSQGNPAHSLQGLGTLSRFERSGCTFDFYCATGGVLRIEVLAPEIVRVRVAAEGAFAESVTVRWGYVRDRWDPVSVSVEQGDGSIVLQTEAWTIRVDRQPVRLTFLDRSGRVIAQETAPARTLPGGGSAITMEMAGDEHFYGFGFQRLALDARGKELEWTRKFRSREATVPFFMSTRGYGFYSNNTWKHTFDFTCTDGPKGGCYTVSTAGGQLDYFVLYGPAFRDILRHYTDLTGRPTLAPRWAMGLLYICRYFETQEGVLDIADRFRERDIPCDMIGLEPGWEDVPYSMTWQWSPERFPDPAGMIQELAQRGFMLEIWESGDAPKSGYADPEVRRDWFRQRIPTSLAIGVRFFKQDDPYPRGIISEELQTPILGAPLESSGDLTAEELLSLTNTLYCETLVKEYRRYTGQRAFVIFNSYTASVVAHRWPTAWAADFAASCGLLSASLSGHAMVSLDMRTDTLAGIHYGFLMPFSIIDAWAYYKEPWLYPEYLEECHRFYAKLRHRLAPYLYSSLFQAHQSAVPMMRPMVLDHPQDPNVQSLTTQHMLGDWLLVGLEPRVYLPAGSWIDYWTGETHRSAGEWVECTFDEPAGGPLLVKEGAILPIKPISRYLEQEAADLILLDVYPAKERSTYTLYEDDGETYAYESGAFAITALACQRTDDTVHVAIGERAGNYEGRPAARTYLLSVHVGAPPEEVRRGGVPLLACGTREGLLYGGESCGWWYDDERGVAWIKPDGGWRFDYDERGPAGDPERDTLRWATDARPAGETCKVMIHLPTGKVQTVAKAKCAQAPGVGPVPDRLHVVANPPERIALRHSTWLPCKTNLYVSIKSGEQTVHDATNVVRMEVLDVEGNVIESEEKQAQRGRVEFLGMAYKPEETIFYFTSPGLQPCEVYVRKPPVVHGRMR